MDVMERRRALMAMQSELPSGYRKVEWLKSTGTQYIDTGYYPTINTTVEIKFVYNGLDTNDHNPFGSRGRLNEQDFTIWTNSSKSKGIALHYPINQARTCDTSWVYIGDITANPLNLLVTPERIFVDDVAVYAFSETRTFYQPSYSAYVFAARGPASSFVRDDNAYTIYQLTLKEGSTVYKNFIPCVRKSDNKPGMYDTISKAFYTNAGTGEFIFPA